QCFWGSSYVYRWGPIERIDELKANADVPAGAQPGELIAPAVIGGLSNVAVLRGLRVTPGYTGLVTSSVLDSADPVVQQIAGVAWRAAGTPWGRVPRTLPPPRPRSAARRRGHPQAA